MDPLAEGVHVSPSLGGSWAGRIVLRPDMPFCNGVATSSSPDGCSLVLDSHSSGDVTVPPDWIRHIQGAAQACGDGLHLSNANLNGLGGRR